MKCRRSNNRIAILKSMNNHVQNGKKSKNDATHHLNILIIIICTPGPRPKAQGPRPKARGPRPKAQGPRPKAQGPGPKAQGPRPKAQGPRPKAQGPGPRAQGPGPKALGLRPEAQGPGSGLRPNKNTICLRKVTFDICIKTSFPDNEFARNRSFWRNP